MYGSNGQELEYRQKTSDLAMSGQSFMDYAEASWKQPSSDPDILKYLNLIEKGQEYFGSKTYLFCRATEMSAFAEKKVELAFENVGILCHTRKMENCRTTNNGPAVSWFGYQ
ncbi:hypothetical protein CS542_06835 [Pedobacter sp. IW39]|nr:hypothetical protein CS542_06835 [Pedobacter sp. IW39]